MIQKSTKISGGQGRSGRVLRTTIPSKLARQLGMARGDRILWFPGPGDTLTVALASKGIPKKYATKPATRRRKKEAIDYLLEGMQATVAEELITPTEKML